MSLSTPNGSKSGPAETLVAGSGCCAKVLGYIFGFEPISMEMLKRGPQPLESGAYPCVLDSVRYALLVGEGMWSAADAIWWQDRLWRWIEASTRAAEYHEVGIVFVLADRASPSIEASLASALGSAAFDSATGVAVWRQSEPLTGLVSVLAKVGKTNLQTMRTRRASQPKRLALSQLRAAIEMGGCAAMENAVRIVQGQFRDDAYTIDTFCKPPFHANGNAWRAWLLGVVTEGVTPERRDLGLKLLQTLSI